jgi:D-alanine-D-alanine ligase
LPFPLFIKPNAQGSSVGSGKVLDKESLAAVLQNALDFGQPALVERLIDGKELTVGILNNHALPIVEIVPQQGFYDYQNKYTPGNTVYHCPARISDEVAKRVQELALEAHRSIGNPVYSRVDFLLENDTDPYCLEVNTIPGMTGTSLLPKSAAAAGISFPELCKKIVVLSWERHLQQLEPTPEPALLKPERQEPKTQ